jgi:hypothetical protein
MYFHYVYLSCNQYCPQNCSNKSSNLINMIESRLPLAPNISVALFGMPVDGVNDIPVFCPAGIGITSHDRLPLAAQHALIVATEVVGGWKKSRKKDYCGARPQSRLGPAGPFYNSSRVMGRSEK